MLISAHKEAQKFVAAVWLIVSLSKDFSWMALRRSGRPEQPSRRGSSSCAWFYMCLSCLIIRFSGDGGHEYQFGCLYDLLVSAMTLDRRSIMGFGYVFNGAYLIIYSEIDERLDFPKSAWIHADGGIIRSPHKFMHFSGSPSVHWSPSTWTPLRERIGYPYMRPTSWHQHLQEHTGVLSLLLPLTTVSSYAAPFFVEDSVLRLVQSGCVALNARSITSGRNAWPSQIVILFGKWLCLGAPLRGSVVR